MLYYRNCFNYSLTIFFKAALNALTLFVTFSKIINLSDSSTYNNNEFCNLEYNYNLVNYNIK